MKFFTYDIMNKEASKIQYSGGNVIYLSRFLVKIQKEKQKKICSNHLEMMEFTKMDEEFQDFRSAKRKGSIWPNTGEWKKRFYNERAILAVDEYSLILFPVSFATFNFAYWLYFINTGTEPVSTH